MRRGYAPSISSSSTAQTLRDLPLIERKKQQLKVIRRSVGIEFVEHVTGDGPLVFEKACELGYDGHRVEADRPAVPSRRHEIWLKMKNPDHPAIKRVKEALRKQADPFR